MGIPENLMNIMSCHGFPKYPISTVILTCRSALVTHNLNKGCNISKTEEVGPANIPIRTKEKLMLLISIPKKVSLN